MIRIRDHSERTGLCFLSGKGYISVIQWTLPVLFSYVKSKMLEWFVKDCAQWRVYILLYLLCMVIQSIYKIYKNIRKHIKIYKEVSTQRNVQAKKLLYLSIHELVHTGILSHIHSTQHNTNVPLG